MAEQREVKMQIERIHSNALVVNKLPDGSQVIIDSENETVLALNATAGAAWDACSVPTTLSGVTESMQRSLGAGITEDLAEHAILQLQAQKLVTTSGAPTQATRRQFITTLGAIAIPLIVSLPIAEQRAYAEHARSAPSPTSPPSSPPSKGGKGGIGGILGWLLGLLGL
jgi:hypothetical protein